MRRGGWWRIVRRGTGERIEEGKTPLRLGSHLIGPFRVDRGILGDQLVDEVESLQPERVGVRGAPGEVVELRLAAPLAQHPDELDRPRVSHERPQLAEADGPLLDHVVEQRGDEDLRRGVSRREAHAPSVVDVQTTESGTTVAVQLGGERVSITQ